MTILLGSLLSPSTIHSEASTPFDPIQGIHTLSQSHSHTVISLPTFCDSSARLLLSLEFHSTQDRVLCRPRTRPFRALSPVCLNTCFVVVATSTGPFRNSRDCQAKSGRANDEMVVSRGDDEVTTLCLGDAHVHAEVGRNVLTLLAGARIK